MQIIISLPFPNKQDIIYLLKSNDIAIFRGYIQHSIRVRISFPLTAYTREDLCRNQRLPYSQKIWWGIKFGGLAVYIITAKLKSAKISTRIYTYGDPVPNRQI